MKTPREFLFERHRTADAKLDSIRQNVLAAECRNEFQKRKPQTTNLRAFPLRIGIIFWRELIWPSRRIWAGFAVAWAVIILANFTDRDEFTPRMAQSKIPPAKMLLALQQQQQKMWAEFDSHPEPAEAEKPKMPPQPRSSIRPPFEMA
jgi:hypothetical protein